jgi:hypothetical protein
MDGGNLALNGGGTVRPPRGAGSRFSGEERV